MKEIKYGGTIINSYYERGSEIFPNNTSSYKYFNVKEVEIYKIENIN